MKLFTEVVICVMFVLAITNFSYAQNSVTQKERRALLKTIIERESLHSQLSIYGEFNQAADEMKVKKISQSNGIALYVIDFVLGTMLCGSTGNCQAWVYKKSGSSFDLLLSSEGISPLKTSTSGFRDFTTADGSIAAQGLEKGVLSYQTIYKWNGDSYAPHCFKNKRVGKRKKSIPIPCS